MKRYDTREADRESMAVANAIMEIGEDNDYHPAHVVSGCCAVIAILICQLPAGEAREGGTKMVYDLLHRMFNDAD